MAEESLQCTEEDSELELPFEKLNVSNETTNRFNNNVIKNKQVDDDAGKKQNNLTLEKSADKIYHDEDLARSYCIKKKRKHYSKSVIRKAKLILPVELQSKQKSKNQKTICENESDEETNKVVNEDTLISSGVQSSASTCGSQYMNTFHSTDTLLGDEHAQYNANELASYFEQMLYIPKPMSLMAEMMYA